MQPCALQPVFLLEEIMQCSDLGQRGMHGSRGLPPSVSCKLAAKLLLPLSAYLEAALCYVHDADALVQGKCQIRVWQQVA